MILPISSEEFVVMGLGVLVTVEPLDEKGKVGVESAKKAGLPAEISGTVNDG